MSILLFSWKGLIWEIDFSFALQKPATNKSNVITFQFYTTFWSCLYFMLRFHISSLSHEKLTCLLNSNEADIAFCQPYFFSSFKAYYHVVNHTSSYGKMVNCLKQNDAITLQNDKANNITSNVIYSPKLAFYTQKSQGLQWITDKL